MFNAATHTHKCIVISNTYPEPHNFCAKLSLMTSTTRSSSHEMWNSRAEIICPSSNRMAFVPLLGTEPNLGPGRRTSSLINVGLSRVGLLTADAGDLRRQVYINTQIY